MLRRFFAAGLIALAIGVISARPQAAARPDDQGYDFWGDCHSLPDPFEFLPIYLGSDTPGFVDLERVDTINLTRFRALQYTRDKDFGRVPIKAGTWYGGMGADRWPVRTVSPASLYQHFRITAWEVDGTLYPIDPSCVLTMETDELSLGLYNVWVRFSDPGLHTLKIFGKQHRPFPFTDPLIATGGIDPFGLEGRRLFVMGEEVWDVLDQQFVHSYELQVRKEDGH